MFNKLIGLYGPSPAFGFQVSSRGFGVTFLQAEGIVWRTFGNRLNYSGDSRRGGSKYKCQYGLV